MSVAVDRARRVIAASRPRDAALHVFDGHLFVADRSRLYDLDPSTLSLVEAALGSGEPAAGGRLLEQLGLDMPPAIEASEILEVPPVRALSLNVAQTCNLACTYCYASGGDFGLGPRTMSVDVADAAVTQLVGTTPPGAHVTIAFLGGEPMLSRRLIHHVVAEADRRGAERGVAVSYSITTNGTRLAPADAAFLAEHRFAVTISMDGVGATHDLLRPTRRGEGSFDTIAANLGPLLAERDRISLSARVTVTRFNLDLLETLHGLSALGLPSIGFSPLLSSPGGDPYALKATDVERLLAGMLDCGAEFEAAIQRGEGHPFANLSTALTEIHRGRHQPFPCGAGAGYLGVSATGALSACHRFVGDERGDMGDVVDGPDHAARATWLADRHVDRQQPCSGCWARYLCGGGCHHEVINEGRPMCEYIRGWLHYCLGAYVRLEGWFPVQHRG